jgi:predicted alpha/beta-hydrolase family hydrolase
VSERIRVKITPDESVTAIGYPAASRDRAGVTLILGPGAGSDQASEFMAGFATALAARGIDVVTFNFSYMEHGRRMPDRNDKLEACYVGVMEAVRNHANFGRGKLVIGGKSMGGRIASHIAANRVGDPRALVLLGYPLHPPGVPDQLRAKHLSAIKVPILVIQGSRDAFGTPDELRPMIRELKAPTKLYVVADGDHSFKVTKRSGVTQEQVYEAVQDEIEQWLRNTVAM